MGKRKTQTKQAEYDGSTPLRSVFMERFIAGLVLEGLNQTQAYKTAGYKVKSDDVAKVCASQLLTRPNVSLRRDYLLRQQAVRHTDKKDKCLRVLESAIDSADIAWRDRIAAIKEYGDLMAWHKTTIAHESADRQAILDERERELARRIALATYNPHLLPGTEPPVIDAELQSRDTPDLSSNVTTSDAGCDAGTDVTVSDVTTSAVSDVSLDSAACPASAAAAQEPADE